MTETSQNVSTDTGLAVPAAEKKLAVIVYILQALSIFIGFTGIAGLILNYVKRDELTSDVVRSHFSWQIRTFWWALLWFILGGLLLAVVIGFPILLTALIWYIYRVVIGYVRLNDNKII
jgi:uncharacterized membrane protein